MHPSNRSVKGLKMKLQLSMKSNIMGEFFVCFSQHSFFEVLTSEQRSLAWKEKLRWDFQAIALEYSFKYMYVHLFIFFFCRLLPDN